MKYIVVRIKFKTFQNLMQPYKKEFTSIAEQEQIQ